MDAMKKFSSELHWVILPMKRRHIRVLLLSVLILLGIPSNASSEFPRADRNAGHYNEVIVSVAPGTLPAALLKRSRALGPSERYYALPFDSSDSFEAFRKLLFQYPQIYRVEPNIWLKRIRTMAFNDPLYASQWYHTTLESEVLFELTHGTSDVRVAVIDSAIELSHPDLAGALVAPLDVYQGDDDPSPEPGDYCIDAPEALCDDHGTAVTGVIAARANNNIGVVGFCAQCTVIPIRLIGEYIAPLSADIEAFEHAIAQDAWVINNSWGYAEAIPVSDTLREVIDRANSEPRNGKGAVVVFAAGNDNREIEEFELGALPNILSVSATDQFGNPTPYTNTGASIDLSAPSATVSTSVNGDYTSSFGGTSAAAPVVSGIAALVLSANPELTSQEVRDLLTQTAFKDGRVQFDAQGHHKTFGFGFIDPGAIREALETETSKGGGCQSQTGATLLPLLGLLVALALLNRKRSPSEL